MRNSNGNAFFPMALKCRRANVLAIACALTYFSAGLTVAASPSPASPKRLSADLQGLYRGSFALVIGAANYRNGWDPLPGALEDVKAISKLLSETGFEVTQVLDPTREELEGALRKFVEMRGQDRQNRLVIYFAGHGDTVDSSIGPLGYIVPIDVPVPRKGYVGAFKANALSMLRFEEISRQIESKHVLFIFDSCFSGSIFQTRSASIPEAISERTAYATREFLTAGTEDQQTSDSGDFRRRLDRALRGDADLNNDGYITGVELGEYMADTVAGDTHRAQTPRFGKIRDPSLDKGDIVFTYPGFSVLRRPVAEWLGGAGEGSSRTTPAVSRAEPGHSDGTLSRLGGQAFYLPQLDVTVVANGNLPAAHSLGVSGIAVDGTMSSATASRWIEALNDSRYLGFSDWRLPKVEPVNQSGFRVPGEGDPAWRDGSADVGYNISAPGTRFSGSRSSEMAFLYYNIWHNHASFSPDGRPMRQAQISTQPLRDVLPEEYWTGRPYGSEGQIVFDFGSGAQWAQQSSSASNPESGFHHHVIVFRSGDVTNSAE